MNGLAGPLHGLANQVSSLLGTHSAVLQIGDVHINVANTSHCRVGLVLFVFRMFTNHGRVLQEVLRWIQDVVADIGSEVSLDQLKDYIHKTLKSGRVHPLSKMLLDLLK